MAAGDEQAGEARAGDGEPVPHPSHPALVASGPSYRRTSALDGKAPFDGVSRAFQTTAVAPPPIAYRRFTRTSGAACRGPRDGKSEAWSVRPPLTRRAVNAAPATKRSSG